MDPGTDDEEPARAGGSIRIAPGVSVSADDLVWRFSTSGGPGGQHANRASTRAEVVLDIATARELPDWARQRLLARLGPAVSATASDERSQARNRARALERLTERLQSALKVAPARHATRPTLGSKRRRLEMKRRRSEQKRQRSTRRDGDWE